MSYPKVANPVFVFVALLAGLVFGVGLVVAGMANPAKVLGFLDLAGRWDPSLIFGWREESPWPPAGSGSHEAGP